jgi:FKBP-type peptidyl-prolyl cis-trans isomerase
MPSIPPDAIHCVSGLVYQVVRPGDGGEKPGPEDVVRVVYDARTEAGEPFDSAGGVDTPATLSVADSPPGLAEAFQLMSVGERIRAWIPPRLQSAEAREADVGTLAYDLELVGFTRTREYPTLPIELTSPRRKD